MKSLIIVESPTKARTLSRFLGKDYSIVATMGHIKDLPKSKLGIDIEKNFKPDYIVVEKREKEIDYLKSKAEKAKRIYIATDPDREGEAIAQHVEEVLRDQRSEVSRKNKPKLKPLSSNKLSERIVFHEITKDAVETAINNPRKIDKNLVYAQIGRRVLDRLVGYKLSPLLWKKVRIGLSAGRVQSVAVRLIVEREKEIEDFKAEEYWEIYCKVKCQRSNVKGEPFVIKLIRINDKKAEIKDGKQAKEIVKDLKVSDYQVDRVEKKEIRKGPYPPFTTSTMTQAAARLFGWSAKRTMSVAQKLYEEGLITYHRTDSVNLAQEAIIKVRNLVQKQYGDRYLPERLKFYKTKSKLAQEAHEAIRPTKIKMTNDKFQMINGRKNEHKKLYQLIWKRFVACQMADSIYDETTIDVTASAKLKAQSSKLYLLRATGQVMKFEGWKVVYGGMTSNKTQITNGENQLPDVEKDEELKLIKVDPQQKFTQPPARYTEATLIKTLEKLGIGRPSTYAPIISTIQIRQYVEKDEGKFKPTLVGKAVNDFLIKNFPDLFEYSFTAAMEDDLDNIANGKREWTKMVGEFFRPFGKKLTSVEEKAKRVKIETEKLGKKCPVCKTGELVVRIGRFGKFISCSKFPKCKYTERYEDRVGLKCPKCKNGQVIIKKTGKGRKFFGCSNYPNCKWASWKDPRLTSIKSSKENKE